MIYIIFIYKNYEYKLNIVIIKINQFNINNL